MLKFALLGFLNYRPMTGYDLKGIMDTSTSYFWHAKQSQIYVTLKTLEEEGMVISQVEVQENSPDRRVYTITDAGRTALGDWLAKPVTGLDTSKHTILLKLFFSAPLSKDTILTQLRLQRKLHLEQGNIYKNETESVIKKAAARMPDDRRDPLFWEATRRFGELYEELYVRWLDETIELIEKEF